VRDARKRTALPALAEGQPSSQWSRSTALERHPHQCQASSSAASLSTSGFRVRRSRPLVRSKPRLPNFDKHLTGDLLSSLDVGRPEQASAGRTSRSPGRVEADPSSHPVAKMTVARDCSTITVKASRRGQRDFGRTQASMEAMLASSCRLPAAGVRLSSRRSWSAVSSMASAAVFSSTRATRRVPGIGAMSFP